MLKLLICLAIAALGAFIAGLMPERFGYPFGIAVGALMMLVQGMMPEKPAP